MSGSLGALLEEQRFRSLGPQALFPLTWLGFVPLMSSSKIGLAGVPVWGFLMGGFLAGRINVASEYELTRFRGRAEVLRARWISLLVPAAAAFVLVAIAGWILGVRHVMAGDLLWLGGYLLVLAMLPPGGNFASPFTFGMAALLLGLFVAGAWDPLRLADSAMYLWFMLLFLYGLALVQGIRTLNTWRRADF